MVRRQYGRRGLVLFMFLMALALALPAAAQGLVQRNGLTSSTPK